MSAPDIQFISAEELRKAAEMDRDATRKRTVGGMIDMMDKVLEDLGGDQFMLAWAQEDPGEFFKLMARLKVGDKDKSAPQVRIQIGLPMTGLDALPGPNADS